MCASESARVKLFDVLESRPNTLQPAACYNPSLSSLESLNNKS